MKQIIIDTNALMAIAEMKIDIFSEIERVCDFRHDIFVLEGTITELEKIQKDQKMKFRRAAKLAVDILTKKKIKIIQYPGSVDDVLTELSKKDCLVLTQDKELKTRLAKPYLTIRQGKRIVVVR
jgi:rRNA-processing protein FCF1